MLAAKRFALDGRFVAHTNRASANDRFWRQRDLRFPAPIRLGAHGRETSTFEGASARRCRARLPIAVVVAILPLLCVPITRRSGQPISLRITAYGLSSIVSMRSFGR